MHSYFFKNSIRLYVFFEKIVLLTIKGKFKSRKGLFLKNAYLQYLKSNQNDSFQRPIYMNKKVLKIMNRKV